MSPLQTIGFALLIFNTVIGMVANGFIIHFIGIDWFGSRKLSPTDLILWCLGLSRFLWHIVIILNAIMVSFFRGAYLQSYTWLAFSTIWLFMETVNLWFAAWLGVLYFAKVAIFSHSVFLHMKRRFPGLVPWLLLGSVVFSAAVTITAITVRTYVFPICHPGQLLSCNSNDSAIQTLNCSKFPIIFIVPNIIPFVLFLSSSIFLTSSLWKHLRRMQHNGIDIKDLNTQAHLIAIKALTSFAVLYLSSFVAVILKSVQPMTKERHWTATIFENVSALYPSGHAIILILINPKLKQMWVKMLHNFKCCLSEAPA